MRRFGLPVVPAIIGIILGPVAEEQLRRALQISNGDLSGLYDTWFSKAVYLVIVLLLVLPPVVRAVRERRGRSDGPGPDVPRDEPLSAHAHANVEGL
jgi:putative tricarboxylic transport membrane protein